MNIKASNINHSFSMGFVVGIGNVQRYLHIIANNSEEGTLADFPLAALLAESEETNCLQPLPVRSRLETGPAPVAISSFNDCTPVIMIGFIGIILEP